MHNELFQRHPHGGQRWLVLLIFKFHATSPGHIPVARHPHFSKAVDSKERKAETGHILMKPYLSHNHPVTHLPRVRNFSSTFWKPRHLLTGTGLQTKKRQRSQWDRLRILPQLTRVSPKQFRGSQIGQERSKLVMLNASNQTREMKAEEQLQLYLNPSENVWISNVSFIRWVPTVSTQTAEWKKTCLWPKAFNKRLRTEKHRDSAT